MGAIKNLVQTYRLFNKNHGWFLGAALAFYGLLAGIPLLFLLLSFLGFVLGTSEDLFPKIIVYLKDIMPVYSPGIINSLHSLINNCSKIGLLGLLILILVADGLLGALEYVLNYLFGIEQRRKFLHVKLINALIFMGGGLAFVVSFFVRAQKQVAEAYGLKFFKPAVVDLFVNNLFLGHIFPWLILVAISSSLYLILPRSHPSFKNALIGGIFCTVLWKLSEYLFMWYIKSISIVNLIYGSLGTIIFLLIWVYYSTCLFLFTGQLVFVLHQRSRN